jgi:hypothetical protein
MMLSGTGLLLWCLVMAALTVPVWWAWRLVWLYRFSPGVDLLPAEKLPPAAVVLPLRGVDPWVEQCLLGILQQDYPCFTVRIVVDNRSDPAWEFITNLLEREEISGRADVRLEVLEGHCATCSLKVSAQAQAISRLESRYEVIVFVDADVVPPRNWLRTLISPLEDPAVGAATGIRWYAPRQPTWGALVRHLWNSASQAQMFAFGIAWGGSLALRVSLFRDAEFFAQWKRCLCDDSGAADLVLRRGLRIRFLPSMTMVNQEAIDLPNCIRFIRRQLLCPRMDHACWPVLLMANLATLLAISACVACIILGLWRGEPLVAAWYGGALATYFLAQLSAFVYGECLIRRIVAARGQAIDAPLPSWKLLVAPLLTQLLQVYWLLAAIYPRRTVWRGVEYRLRGQHHVRLVEYRPFEQRTAGPATGESVI